MNEQQRREYLSSMGYEVYYPRFKLPGAKPSPRYQLPAVEVEVEEAASTAVETTATPSGRVIPDSAAPIKQPRPSPLPKPEPEKIKPRGKPESAAPTVEPASASSDMSEQQDELRFSLQYFAVNGSLAVINEAPHQLRGKQSRESMALLQAIVKALLPEQDIPGLDPLAFDWPIAEGLTASDPKRAASLALQGFINQRHAQDGFANLLVFAAQIQDLLDPAGQSDSLGDQTQTALKCQLTTTHSLQSMLVHPQLKREVWAHLQPLRQRLGTK